MWSLAMLNPFVFQPVFILLSPQHSQGQVITLIEQSYSVHCELVWVRLAGAHRSLLFRGYSGLREEKHTSESNCFHGLCQLARVRTEKLCQGMSVVQRSVDLGPEASAIIGASYSNSIRTCAASAAQALRFRSRGLLMFLCP